MQFVTAPQQNSQSDPTAALAQQALTQRLANLEGEYRSNQAALVERNADFVRLQEMKAALDPSDPKVAEVDKALTDVAREVLGFSANLGIIERVHAEVLAVATAENPVAAMESAAAQAVETAQAIVNGTPAPAPEAPAEPTPDPIVTPAEAEPEAPAEPEG